MRARFWQGSQETPARRKRQHGRRLAGGTASGGKSRRGARKSARPRTKTPGPPGGALHWARPLLRSLLGRGGRRVLVGAVAVALGAVAFWGGRIGAQGLAAHPALAVQEVEWVGARHADPEELRSLAEVEPGLPWASLDTEAIRFRVESHPWVARARVRRPWIGKVRILVEECQALAFVNVDGQRYGLCADLRLVPVTGEEGDLPIIRDFASGREVDPGTLARGLDYVNILRDLGLQEPLQLDLRKSNVDIISLPDRGFTAEVGAAIAASEAARSVAAFLETLDAEGGQRGTLRLISEGTAVWRAAA